MPKIDVNSLSVGNFILHESKLWSIVRKSHTQPGKGGAYLQLELKALKQGNKNNIRLRTSETVERAILEEEVYQYLYSSGDILSLMHNENFEQIEVPAEMLGDSVSFLEENMNVTVLSYHNEIISVRLPSQVVCRVKEADASVKGQTATSSYKSAILENNVKIMVPVFIQSGDKLVINTETLEYVERAK